MKFRRNYVINEDERDREREREIEKERDRKREGERERETGQNIAKKINYIYDSFSITKLQKPKKNLCKI